MESQFSQFTTYLLISLFNHHLDSPMVITEYVPYGDLLGYLRKSQGLKDIYYRNTKKLTPLKANKLLRFAWQIANGMEYLSSKKVSYYLITRTEYLMRAYLVRNNGSFPLSLSLPLSLSPSLHSLSLSPSLSLSLFLSSFHPALDTAFWTGTKT